MRVIFSTFSLEVNNATRAPEIFSTNKKTLCKHFHIIRVAVVKMFVQTGSPNREKPFLYLNYDYLYKIESP